MKNIIAFQLKILIYSIHQPNHWLLHGDVLIIICILTRDIVKAAHLKPLEKDDRLTDMKFTQPWNTQASKKKDDNGKLDNDNIPKVYT